MRSERGRFSSRLDRTIPWAADFGVDRAQGLNDLFGPNAHPLDPDFLHQSSDKDVRVFSSGEVLYALHRAVA